MNALEHSPLPWTVLGDTHIVDPCAWTVASCHFGGDSEQAASNARLIIRAVNSHAALLAAAKMAIGTISSIPVETYNALQAAIAAAEEPAK